MVARQVIGAGEAGIAAADDGDIGVEIAGHVIAARHLIAGRGRPIGNVFAKKITQLFAPLRLAAPHNFHKRFVIARRQLG